MTIGTHFEIWHKSYRYDMEMYKATIKVDFFMLKNQYKQMGK